MDLEDFFANYPPAEGENDTTKTEAEKSSTTDTKTEKPFLTQTVVADVDEDEEKPQEASADAIFAPAPPVVASKEGDLNQTSEDAKVGEVMEAEKVEIEGLGAGDDAVQKGKGDAHEGEDEESEKENEKVVAWRKEFAKRLEEKVAREKRVKAERMEKGNEILKNMNKKWVEKCEKNKQVNREDEKIFLAERDGLIGRMSKKGEKPNWGLVEHFADLSGKYKQGQRDTSRMRQVILRMKAAQHSSS